MAVYDWPHLNSEHIANKEPHGAGAYSGSGHMDRQTAGERASDKRECQADMVTSGLKQF